MKVRLLNYALLLISANVQAQGHVGNGGNGCEIEFKSVALKVATYLMSHASLYPEINQEVVMKRALSFTPIESDHPVTDLCGRGRQAINLAETDRILFNASVCEDFTHNPARALGLVAHELLGLVGLEKTSCNDYQQSFAFSSKIEMEASEILNLKNLSPPPFDISPAFRKIAIHCEEDRSSAIDNGFSYGENTFRGYSADFMADFSEAGAVKMRNLGVKFSKDFI